MAIEHAERLRAGWVSVLAAGVVLTGKTSAYILTGSAAIYSDAMESIVNVVAAVMLVWTLIVASRPADEDHPYGHGKVEFFSAGLEGALIVVASLLIAIQALRQLWEGAAPQQLGIGMWLLAGSGLLNLALGVFLLRAGKRTHSLALRADGRHVLADVWTSVGVLLGLAAVWMTGWAWLDPTVALLVAAWILREGMALTRQSVEGLMDAADETLLQSLATALDVERPPSWIDVHGLRAWRSGAALHADLHLTVPRYYDAEQLHGIHDDVEARLLGSGHGEGDVVVHFDPCGPAHCRACAMPGCAVREEPYDGRPRLTQFRATRTDPEAHSPGAPGINVAVGSNEASG